MKTYIKTSDSILPVHIDIVVEIEYYDPVPVAAAEYKGFSIPDGPVITGIPDAILDSQAIADFDAFLESVEDLCTEYYDLEIYYKNVSPYHSCYFGMLAKDCEGNVVLDFDFSLRISNHEPHRSENSQKHKKERQAALNQITQGKKPRPITKIITVNAEEVDSYEEAYMKVDAIIERVVDIMTRRKH